MNKTNWVFVTIVAAVLAFMQMEIATVHDDVQDIKEFIIKSNEKMKYTSADYNCLAKNIYHEAGVESTMGKFAVAQVTLNRLREGRYGKDICKVVHAKAQFSWTLNKKKLNETPKGQLWEQSKAVATAVLAHGARVPSLKDATYYHTDYIKKPVWTRSLDKIQQVGAHIFYRKA